MKKRCPRTFLGKATRVCCPRSVAIMTSLLGACTPLGAGDTQRKSSDLDVAPVELQHGVVLDNARTFLSGYAAPCEGGGRISSLNIFINIYEPMNSELVVPWHELEPVVGLHWNQDTMRFEATKSNGGKAATPPEQCTVFQKTARESLYEFHGELLAAVTEVYDLLRVFPPNQKDRDKIKAFSRSVYEAFVQYRYPPTDTAPAKIESDFAYVMQQHGDLLRLVCAATPVHLPLSNHGSAWVAHADCLNYLDVTGELRNDLPLLVGRGPVNSKNVIPVELAVVHRNYDSFFGRNYGLAVLFSQRHETGATYRLARRGKIPSSNGQVFGYGRPELGLPRVWNGQGTRVGSGAGPLWTIHGPEIRTETADTGGGFISDGTLFGVVNDSAFDDEGHLEGVSVIPVGTHADFFRCAAEAAVYHRAPRDHDRIDPASPNYQLLTSSCPQGGGPAPYDDTAEEILVFGYEFHSFGVESAVCSPDSAGPYGPFYPVDHLWFSIVDSDTGKSHRILVKRSSNFDREGAYLASIPVEHETVYGIHVVETEKSQIQCPQQMGSCDMNFPGHLCACKVFTPEDAATVVVAQVRGGYGATTSAYDNDAVVLYEHLAMALSQ